MALLDVDPETGEFLDDNEIAVTAVGMAVWFLVALWQLLEGPHNPDRNLGVRSVPFALLLGALWLGTAVVGLRMVRAADRERESELSPKTARKIEWGCSVVLSC